MTLVINCLTHNYLLQVSDRRLVKLSNYEIVDDNANKNVFYCGHVAFSYTGIAEIEGKRTDDWLISILPESFQTWIKVVQEKSTEAFRNLPIPGNRIDYKRHAFVGIGWLRAKPDGPLIPALVIISNYYNNKGEILNYVDDEFNVFSLGLFNNRKFDIFSVGQQIPDTELNILYRNVKTCIDRNTGPKTILRHIINTMRKVAKNNKMVGENLLVLGMPKAAAGNPGMVFPFVEDKVNTFFYLPANSQDLVAYGPSIKCQGLTMSHLEMHRGLH